MKVTHFIFEQCLCLILLMVPVFCLARFTFAIFSSKLRETIRRKWLSHTLLVVTSVVIVAAMVVSGQVITDAAKMAKTGQEAAQLMTGILSYETEYSEPPATSDNASLVKILTGHNTRGIMFLSPSRSELNDKGEMVDAWQKPFRISMADPNHPLIFSTSPQYRAIQMKSQPAGVRVDWDDN